MIRTTKNWGTVTGAELYMLAHAERHRKQLERIHKKKPTGQRLPAFNLHKNK